MNTTTASSLPSHLRFILLRGGRLRKTARGVLTYAPFMGLMLAGGLAMGLAAGFGGVAMAGSCTETAADSNMWNCSGAAAGTDGPITIAGSGGGNVTITSAADFGLNLSMGHGIVVTAPGVANITLDGSITTVGALVDYNAAGHGVRVEPAGNNAVTITSNATITGGIDGISVDGAGGVTITANGNITSSGFSAGGGMLGAGIYVKNTGTGAINITANANIMATNREAIHVENENVAGENVTITVNSGDTVRGRGGIYLAQTSTTTGALLIDVAGTVSSGDGNIDTIDIRGGESQTVILRTGGTIDGLVDSDGTDAILQLSAAAADTTPSTFTLNTLAMSFDGFTNFDKIGDGTWILTGEQVTAEAFTTADVMEGTLRLGDGTNTATVVLGADANLTVAEDATLEVMGANTITGGLDLSGGGTVSLVAGGEGGTSDSLMVTDFVSGGTLTLNVAFASGADTADTLAISGAVSGDSTTIINISATGDSSMLDSGGVTLVNGPSDSGAMAFTPGTLTLADGTTRQFTLERDGTSGDWTLATVVTPTVAAMPCDGTGGTFVCTGSITEPQTLAAASGETLTVTTAADFSITTMTGDAFTLMSDTASTGMNITIGGPITAAGGGIEAEHMGSGAVSITAANITAGGDGIDATSVAAASTMTITANGTIMAANQGIEADHNGTGALSITANAAITSTNEAAIEAETADTVAGMTITANAALSAESETAAKHGISADHDGSAAVEITAAAITASGDGINASTAAGASATTMSISTNGAIMAGDDGIEAVHNGTALTIAAGGDITATAGAGIDADHDGTGALSITAAAITAGAAGITAESTSAATATEGMTITANGDIMAATAGINAVHNGTGALAITAAAVTSSGGQGINANNSSSDATTTSITAGAISSSTEGINVSHQGDGDLTITANGNISSMTEEGIVVSAGASVPNINITANGDIVGGADETAGRRHGIEVTHAAGGNINITTTGTVSAGRDAIAACLGGRAQGTRACLGGGEGNITVSIGALIDTTDAERTAAGTGGGGGAVARSGAAIHMQGGTNHTLILTPGAAIGGGGAANDDASDPDPVTSTGNSGTSTLEFAANAGEEDTFALGGLSGFTGFTEFEKSGAGTWTLTGMQPEGRAFTEASVSAGTLALDAAQFRPGDATLDIASGATLDIMEGSTITGALSNSGTVNVMGAATISGNVTSTAGNISLATGEGEDADLGTDDMLTVSGTFTGTATLDLDFTAATPAADSLVLNGTGNSVTINLRINSETDLTDANIPADLQLVSGTATVMGDSANDVGTCTLVQRGDCEFILATDGSITSLAVTLFTLAPTYEGYASTLGTFAHMASLRERQGNRTYDPQNAIWGQIQGVQSTLTPNATSPNAEYDTGHTLARFGFDLPLPQLDGILLDSTPTLGFNAWLGRGETDITATDAEPGVIETDAFGLAATATTQQGVFYVDGQLQYAAFTSDISVGGRSLASNNGADAISASAEIGLRLPPLNMNGAGGFGAAAQPLATLDGITLTPQIQVTWSSIDFDAFTDMEETRVSLRDGETTAARLGVSAERSVNIAANAATPTLLHANADLHLPFDGETSALIDGDTAISDLEEESISLGIGMSHNWQDGYSISADFATTQGEDTEEYRATLGAHLAF